MYILFTYLKVMVDQLVIVICRGDPPALSGSANAGIKMLEIVYQ